MRIEQDAKLDFKDVLIRPKRSTLSSRSGVDIHREFVFHNSAATYRGIPVIAANMDTVGTFEMARALDAHGLSHGVLVQPSFLGTDNRYLLEALRGCPQRLRGVVMLEPTVSDAELQAMDALGVCGMRLNLVGLPVPPLHAT